MSEITILPYFTSAGPEFNWRDFITLREKDPVHRETLEKMLNRIAQTPDGRALIKQAFDVSGSGKNKVEIATSYADFTFRGKPFESRNWGSGGAADFHGEEGDYEGKLTIDLGRKNGCLGYVTPDGIAAVVPQTDTLVHEMFHLADPHCLPHIAKIEFRPVLLEELAKIVTIEGLDTATQNNVLAIVADRIIRDFWPPDMDMKLDQITAAILQQEDMQPLTRQRTVTIKKPQDILFAGIRGSITGDDSYPVLASDMKAIHPSPNGSWRHEEQCVKYTDRFMMKYFGKSPRQGYGNLVGVPKGTPMPEEPELLASPTQEEKLPPYKADNRLPPFENLPTPLNFIQPMGKEDILTEKPSLWSEQPRNLQGRRAAGMTRQPPAE